MSDGTCVTRTVTGCSKLLPPNFPVILKLPKVALHFAKLLGENLMRGFKQFLLRGNVVDLAVGVVIGAAFAGLVTAVVKDLL